MDLLTKDNFIFLKIFFEEKTGISIDEEKEYLINSRLIPIIKKYNLLGFSDLILAIRANNFKIIEESINAITTNETHFFRDIKPFDYLEKKIIPEFFAKKNSSEDIKIWSAASSSGQEAYSIAIKMHENKHKMMGRSFKILGTDISSAMVERAIEGKYNQFEVQRGLPTSSLIKYFDKKSENYWEIKSEIKNYCSFKYLNLLNDFSSINAVDLVFCRNVLIYFDETTKIQILKRIVQAMSPQAYLILGASETSNLLPEKIKQTEEMPSVFRLL
jgi:chemotaxis protein methyltransferase CheR